MKKLFGRDKPKPVKPMQGSRDIASTGGLTALPEDGNYYAQPYNGQDRQSVRVSSDDRWDLVSHESSSPLVTTYGPRSVSPFQPPPAVPPAVPPKANSIEKRDRDPQMVRRKPPSSPNPAVAVGILKSLDPPAPEPLQREYSDEFSTSNDHSSKDEGKKEKKGFWERAKERERERERVKELNKEKERKEEEGQAEITRMIGYLTASASEDWSLVLELCERASASELNAKEAVKALRKEFKYAEPPAQLSAARLWAIMLRNCSEMFITQCASRKFLDTLEDVIQNSKTSPVVRERLMDVLAGAAYMCPPSQVPDSHILAVRHEVHGFRGLWKKVKPPEKPDEGIPFDTEDAMFNPPTLVAKHPPPQSKTPSPPQQHQSPPHRPHAKRKHSSRKGIIPPDEDIRRLFQECNVGKGNADLLSGALAFAKPEDLREKEIIREFYARCRTSQELIYAAIPWASAGAERSRQARDRHNERRSRSNDGTQDQPPKSPPPPKQAEPKELTVEEQLLDALLGANTELTSALRQYEDLERVGIERDAEERSKKETRIDRSRIYYDADGAHLEPPTVIFGGSSHTPSPSSSPSPSPAPSVTVTPYAQQMPTSPPQINTNSSNNHGSQHSIPSLAPPPPPPHGPRTPVSASNRSRTPSPDRYSAAQGQISRDRVNDIGQQLAGKLRVSDDASSVHSHPGEYTEPPVQPSAKALGKRRAVEETEPAFDTDEMFYQHPNESRRSDEFSDESDDDSHHHHQPWHHSIHYVYDAAAERTAERLKEARLANHLVSEVH